MYSRFDPRLTIKRIVQVLQRDDSGLREGNHEQYLTLQSKLQSQNLDLIENDKMLNNYPADVRSRLDLLQNDIEVNDSDPNLPDRVICDEERLSHVVMCLMAKILQLYQRA